MTGEEWTKLCKEHGVVVIDVNYKNMTHEDAVKYFDLLNTAMDHAFARKYDLVKICVFLVLLFTDK